MGWLCASPGVCLGRDKSFYIYPSIGCKKFGGCLSRRKMVGNSWAAFIWLDRLIIFFLPFYIRSQSKY